MYDLCIIGGGVAGISAAISAASLGMKVAIIEKDKKLGRKIYATGNGRCNLTNKYIDLEKCYNSSSKDYVEFLTSVIGDYADKELEAFCNSIGILTENNNDYVYPKSYQASSVVWAMTDKLAQLGVKIHFKTFITDICPVDNHFVLKSQNEEFTCSQVVIACGGMSYESLGGTDSGYILSKNTGHKLEDIRPALCGLITDDDITSLSGVRAKAKASLYQDGDYGYSLLSSEIGELQITDYGLSGIMIFNLSSIVGRLLAKCEDFTLTLDFMPNIDIRNIHSICKNCGERTVTGFLNTFINDKLAAYFVEKYIGDTKTKLNTLEKYDIEELIQNIKSYDISISGTNDFSKAQVCAGGVSLKELDPNTLMSMHHDGLYFAGELIDIDGICGGYNITFAMLSGKKAGESAYAKTKSN